MMDGWRDTFLVFLLALALGGCGQPPEDVAAPAPDLLDFLNLGPDLQERFKAQAAEEARFIEDWRSHASERGWELTRPSGAVDREQARACQPSFEAYHEKRPATRYRPGSLHLFFDSLRIGRLENGIGIGTVRASIQGAGPAVHEEMILFRLDTCDVISARFVHDRVRLTVASGGTAPDLPEDTNLMAVWLTDDAAPEVRINAGRNAVAVYIPDDLVQADLDLWADGRCTLADVSAAQATPDDPATLDRLCPGGEVTVTPTLAETTLWLNLFGVDDMAAHLASEDILSTILVDASKRPGLKAPYLLDVHAMKVPDPAAQMQPRPKDMLFLYPLGAAPAEKK
jgi:hypothetical protein